MAQATFSAGGSLRGSGAKRLPRPGVDRASSRLHMAGWLELLEPRLLFSLDGLLGTAPVFIGDANNDNNVTGADFIAVQQHFGQIGDNDGLLLGDADDNGLVTGTDLIAVQQNYGFYGLHDDFADMPGDASLIVIPLVLDGEIQYDSDRDWFRFDVIAGTTLNFALSLAPDTHGKLTLVDSDVQTVLMDVADSAPPAAWPFFDWRNNPIADLAWTAPAAGTYYLVLGPADPADQTASSSRAYSVQIDAFVTDNSRNPHDQAVALPVTQIGKISTTRTFLLNNNLISGEPIQIDQLMLTGLHTADFNITVTDHAGSLVPDISSFTIPAGQSYGIAVYLAPTAAGVRQAQIQFESSSVYSLMLRGLGYDQHVYVPVRWANQIASDEHLAGGLFSASSGGSELWAVDPDCFPDSGCANDGALANRFIDTWDTVPDSGINAEDPDVYYGVVSQQGGTMLMFDLSALELDSAQINGEVRLEMRSGWQLNDPVVSVHQIQGVGSFNAVVPVGAEPSGLFASTTWDNWFTPLSFSTGRSTIYDSTVTGVATTFSRHAETLSPFGSVVGVNERVFDLPTATTAALADPVLERPVNGLVNILNSGVDHDGMTPMLLVQDGSSQQVQLFHGSNLVTPYRTFAGPAFGGDLMAGTVVGKTYLPKAAVVIHGLIVFLAEVSDDTGVLGVAFLSMPDVHVVSDTPTELAAAMSVAQDTAGRSEFEAMVDTSNGLGATWAMDNWFPNAFGDVTNVWIAATDYARQSPSPNGGGAMLIRAFRSDSSSKDWALRPVFQVYDDEALVAAGTLSHPAKHAHSFGVVRNGSFLDGVIIIGDGPGKAGFIRARVDLSTGDDAYLDPGNWDYDFDFLGERDDDDFEQHAADQSASIAPGPDGTLITTVDVASDGIKKISLPAWGEHPEIANLHGVPIGFGEHNLSLTVRSYQPHLQTSFTAMLKAGESILSDRPDRVLFSTDGSTWIEVAGGINYGQSAIFGDKIVFGLRSQGIFSVPVPTVTQRQPLLIRPGGVNQVRTAATGIYNGPVASDFQVELVPTIFELEGVQSDPATFGYCLNSEGQVWLDPSEGDCIDPHTGQVLPPPPTYGPILILTMEPGANPIGDLGRFLLTAGQATPAGDGMFVLYATPATDRGESINARMGLVSAPVPAFANVNHGSNQTWLAFHNGDKLEAEPQSVRFQSVRNNRVSQRMYVAIGGLKVREAGQVLFREAWPGYPAPHARGAEALIDYPDELESRAVTLGGNWTVRLAGTFPADGPDPMAQVPDMTMPLATVHVSEDEYVYAYFTWINNSSYVHLNLDIVTAGQVVETLETGYFQHRRQGQWNLVISQQPGGMGATLWVSGSASRLRPNTGYFHVDGSGRIASGEAEIYMSNPDRRDVGVLGLWLMQQDDLARDASARTALAQTDPGALLGKTSLSTMADTWSDSGVVSLEFPEGLLLGWMDGSIANNGIWLQTTDTGTLDPAITAQGAFQIVGPTGFDPAGDHGADYFGARLVFDLSVPPTSSGRAAAPLPLLPVGEAFAVRGQFAPVLPESIAGSFKLTTGELLPVTVDSELISARSNILHLADSAGHRSPEEAMILPDVQRSQSRVSSDLTEPFWSVHFGQVALRDQNGSLRRRGLIDAWSEIQPMDITGLLEHPDGEWS